MIFIKLDTFPSNKYIAGSISGVLSLNEIYTLEEIMSNHPDVKEVKNLLEIGKQYNQP